MFDHDRPVIRSTTRMADTTAAIVPCPGKTESPTTHRPGPGTSEPTARKLLFDRDTGGQPTAPPGITAEAPGRGELGVHEGPRRLGQGLAECREHHAAVIRLLPLVLLAIEALPGGGSGCVDIVATRTCPGP
jgi:hypothetical protein